MCTALDVRDPHLRGLSARCRRRQPRQVGGVVVTHEPPAADGVVPAPTVTNSVIDVFAACSSKPPVVGARSSWRKTASITPPWQTITIVDPACSATSRGQRRSDPQVELRRRLAAGKDDGVRVASPVGRAETLDVRFEGHAVEVGARVVLTERRIDLERRAAERGATSASDGLAAARTKLLAMTTSAPISRVSAESGGEPRRLFEPER